MADQAPWYKLWSSATDDDDLDALDIADYGRWCKLGQHTKMHGRDGRVRIRQPARTLCAKLQVSDWDELLAFLRRLRSQLGPPNKDFSSLTVEETIGEPSVSINGAISVTQAVVSVVVTWSNWRKYQGDHSTARVRAWRETRNVDVTRMKRRRNADVTARREEKRREEKRTSRSSSSPPVVENSTTPKGDGVEPAEPVVASRIEFRIPAPVIQALDRATVLSRPEALRKPRYWQSMVRTYGSVDIPAELLEADAWCVANPRKAPKSDFGRFVASWLKRAKEKATEEDR